MCILHAQKPGKNGYKPCWAANTVPDVRERHSEELVLSITMRIAEQQCSLNDGTVGTLCIVSSSLLSTTTTTITIADSHGGSNYGNRREDRSTGKSSIASTTNSSNTDTFLCTSSHQSTAAFSDTTTTTSDEIFLYDPKSQLLLESSKQPSLSPSNPTTTNNITNNNDENVLNWETLEFSKAPKCNARFGATRNVADDPTVEAARDAAHAQALHEYQLAWDRLDPATVQRAIDLLTPYVRPERIQRIHTVLNQRTRQTRFVFENPSNPSNVFVCLRTLEAFGIQHVEIIMDSRLYHGKAALLQKRGMRTAMRAAQWLSLRQHTSTQAALHVLQQMEGCVILASDVTQSMQEDGEDASSLPTTKQSQDIQGIDWHAYMYPQNHHQQQNAESDGSLTVKPRPLCIVMDNEDRDISEEMRQACDGTFYLPMIGFGESFNFPVATTILAHLRAASWGYQDESGDVQQGLLMPGDIPPQEYQCLLLTGMLNSVSQ
jgi:tRNA G18 (ribose-2'-O)-methylase SpoU